MGKVAIVGAGFTGLACGVALAGRGLEVTIFEAAEKCGGLAGGFRGSSEWKWSLEKYYHHIFTSDTEIQNLAKRVAAPVIFKTPETNSFYHLREVPLDSPLSLLRFPGLSFLAKVRMGLGLAWLKLVPNGLFLERHRVVDFLPKLLGKSGYETIWRKLLTAKFGPFLSQVNMAWFWSRIAKRSKSLGYFEGGFQILADKAKGYIEQKGGKVLLKTKVTKIASKEKGGVVVDGEKFDALILTVPAPIVEKLFPSIQFPRLDYLWGQTLVMEVTRKLIKGYWLNILEDHWPFLVVVDHTNFMDKKHYGGKRIMYIGNYLPDGHKQLKLTKEQLLKLYSPFIKKVYKKFNKSMVKNMYLFREPFAQPVFPTNYSKTLPKKRTPIKGVYLANMSMVYPHDRGTNYAVKMGKEVAEMVMKDLKNR